MYTIILAVLFGVALMAVGVLTLIFVRNNPRDGYLRRFLASLITLGGIALILSALRPHGETVRDIRPAKAILVAR